MEKVTKGLSAGRVQSVAVRLIVEREREIQNFKQRSTGALNQTLRKKIKMNFSPQNFLKSTEKH